jgi:hypothetical protein
LQPSRTPARQVGRENVETGIPDAHVELLHNSANDGHARLSFHLSFESPLRAQVDYHFA